MAIEYRQASDSGSTERPSDGASGSPGSEQDDTLAANPYAELRNGPQESLPVRVLTPEAAAAANDRVDRADHAS